MKLMTFGSKLLDDAIKLHNEIKNELRITNISPFSFCRNLPLNLFVKDEDKYEDNMVAFDLGNVIHCESAEYILLDFMDARMHFEEIELENGEKIRLTMSNFTDSHREEIKINAGTILSTRQVDPILFNEEELEEEIRVFAQAIEENYPNKKIVILENQHILYCISEDNKLTLVSNYKNLQRENHFFERCYRLAHKYFSATFLQFPKEMVVCDYCNIWSYPKSYYDYIVQSLKAIIEGTFDQEVYLNKAKKEMLGEIQQLWMNQTRQAIVKACGGRPVIMPKSEMIVPGQLDEKELLNIIVLEEEEFSSIVNIKERSETKYLDRTQFFWFIPFDRINKNILDFLWKFGFTPKEDYLCPLIEPIQLKNFCGTYKDCFQNTVECKTPTNILIFGNNNKIEIETMHKCGSLNIKVFNSNTIFIGQNCQELSTGTKKMEIMCGDNSTLSIGKEGSLGVDLTIDCGNCSDILIGEKSLFSSEVLIKNTLCERLTWQRKTDLFTRSKITIGDHVWIGLRVSVFSGANIGDGSMIGARSLLKKTFPPNSQIVGIYPKDRMIRQGITWTSELNGKKLKRENKKE